MNFSYNLMLTVTQTTRILGSYESNGNENREFDTKW